MNIGNKTAGNRAVLRHVGGMLSLQAVSHHCAVSPGRKSAIELLVYRQQYIFVQQMSKQKERYFPHGAKRPSR